MMPVRWRALSLAAALSLSAAAAEAAPLSVSTEPDGVLVRDGSAPVLFYRTRPPAGAEPWRLHYIHPLYANDGSVLTEDAPKDHVHHRGVFWNWHQIVLGGKAVADGWFMTGIELKVTGVRAQANPDGGAEVSTDVDWIVTSGPTPVTVLKETSRIVVGPSRDNARTLSIDTTLTPQVDDFALGGSDDVKGYGGFSPRFIHPDKMTFTSDGRTVTPANEAVEAGSTLIFGWSGASPAYDATTVSLSCTANGKPITSWILRKSLSMQNCVWPGRQPVAMSKGQPVKLAAKMIITQAQAR